MSIRREGSRFPTSLFWGIFGTAAFLSLMDQRQSVVVRSLEGDSEFQMPSLRELENLDQRIIEELDRHTSQANQPSDRQPGDKNRSIADSMKWLNRSMDSLREKLNHISERLENTRDEERVEEEIKKAFREAFVGASTARAESNASAVKKQESQSTEPGRKSDRTDPAEVADTAEVAEDSKAFEDLATGETAAPLSVDVPVLGDGTPAWIRQRIISDDRILIPIESSMHSTVEECREDLEEKLVGEVKKILDSHLLKRVSADSIPGLTPQYIRGTLIEDAVEFDNYQERPSGNFHQLWVRLNIDPEEIRQIREWEREVTTTARVWMLSGYSLAFLGSFAGLSEVLKFLSNREKKRKRTQATA